VTQIERIAYQESETEAAEDDTRLVLQARDKGCDVDVTYADAIASGIEIAKAEFGPEIWAEHGEAIIQEGKDTLYFMHIYGLANHPLAQFLDAADVYASQEIEKRDRPADRFAGLDEYPVRSAEQRRHEGALWAALTLLDPEVHEALLKRVAEEDEEAEAAIERAESEADEDEDDAKPGATTIIEPEAPETGEKKKRLRLPAWMAGAMINADGWPYQNMHNTLWALRHHPELKSQFAFDEMARKTVVTGYDNAPITDADVIDVQSYLQKHARMSSITGHTVGAAIDRVARDNGFHPIRDYLRSLSWDGKPRLGGMLHVYFGAANTEYHASIGTMFPTAMVARVMRPGCKVDYMPVFEGPQGKGKSQACKILAGEDWFSDHLPDIHSKDASQHLRGKWLIEFAELDKMSRVESSALKAFLTRDTEKYRPPYGRYDVEEPRQCVFFGTVNDSNYLKDETGNRRFWPVACGGLDLGGIARDRDQLLAEAVVKFDAGEKYWPDAAFEAEVIKPVQDERYMGDAWDEDIARYATLNSDGFTMSDLAWKALDIPIDRLDMSAQLRISKSLKLIGLRLKRTTGGKRIWVRAAE